MFTTRPLDIYQIGTFLSILIQKVYNKPWVYFDNAATTQKHFSVIDSAIHFYQQDNANIYRGMHALSVSSTTALKQTRLAVQKFMGAPEVETIVFTSGSTEGINLIAAT